MRDLPRRRRLSPLIGGPGGAVGRPALLAATVLAGAVLGVTVSSAATPGVAAAAAGTGGCGQLSVLSTSTAGSATTAIVSVPVALSRLSLPTGAFRAEQDGQPLRVSVRAVPVPEVAVALVLASTPRTSAARFDAARSAAVDLLSGLPEGSRTSTFTTAQPQPLAALSTERARASQALRLARRGAGAGAVDAVLRAARSLPPGGHVVLFSDAAATEPAPAQQAARAELTSLGVTLDQIGYAAPTEPPPGLLAGPGCPPPGSTLNQVDQVVGEIRGKYEVRLEAPLTRPIQVSVDFAGISSAALLPAGVAEPAADPAPPAPLAAPAQQAAPERLRLQLAVGGLCLLVLVGLLLRSAARFAGPRRPGRAARRPGTSGGYAAAPTVGQLDGVTAQLDGVAAPARPGSADARCGRPILPAENYEEVDVAIVMESTYPYLKGGVSAVVHDIVVGNQDLTFGIVHITWDSASASTDLYGMPANVKWVRPVYLSMTDHREDFSALRPSDLRMRAPERLALSHRLFNALEAVLSDDVQPLWSLYDDGMNPRTRTFPLWALLGSKEFMAASRDRLPNLGLPLTDMFWLLREFFSLACAVLGDDIPKARVYHAHTTGYASLLGAAAARQNDTSFLLTEHNLYVRDTVNVLLERSMALRLSSGDWRAFDVTALERAWMAWWIEMGHFCYPSAEVLTYLYPTAISEAADLGAPVERSVVIPNGMKVRDFEEAYQQRLAVRAQIQAEPERVWRLVYIARVVPIKGLGDLIETLSVLVGRGITNFHLDVLGPTDHHPDYYRMCREKARQLCVEDYLTFRGTVNVRDLLGEFDLLVLPSYNEGQPIVVLEAMTVGIPTVGTNVGGMAQLIDDPLTTPGGRTWQACGLLVNPEYIAGMADGLQTLMRDPAMYEQFAANARGRVASFFQLEDALGAYNRLYRELGHLPVDVLDGGSQPQPVDEDTATRPDVIDLTETRTRPRGGRALPSGPPRRTDNGPKEP